jgi:hypothetical protein
MVWDGMGWDGVYLDRGIMAKGRVTELRNFPSELITSIRKFCNLGHICASYSLNDVKNSRQQDHMGEAGERSEREVHGRAGIGTSNEGQDRRDPHTKKSFQKKFGRS